MILKNIEDKQIVREIMTDPELFSRISEDGAKPENYEPRPDWEYLGIITDDGIIGLFIVHAINSTTFQVHANILEKYRKEYAKRAGKVMIEFFAYSAPDSYQKMIAEVPVCYDDVYNYCLNNRLVLEGINRKSILKKGELMDQYRLGITREEAIEHLRGLNYGCG